MKISLALIVVLVTCLLVQLADSQMIQDDLVTKRLRLIEARWPGSIQRWYAQQQQEFNQFMPNNQQQQFYQPYQQQQQPQQQWQQQNGQQTLPNGGSNTSNGQQQ